MLTQKSNNVENVHDKTWKFCTKKLNYVKLYSSHLCMSTITTICHISLFYTKTVIPLVPILTTKLRGTTRGIQNFQRFAIQLILKIAITKGLYCYVNLGKLWQTQAWLIVNSGNALTTVGHHSRGTKGLHARPDRTAVYAFCLLLRAATTDLLRFEKPSFVNTN